MSDFYAEDIAFTAELLSEFGETVLIERLRSDGEVTDASKPWRVAKPVDEPDDADSFEALGAILPVESRRVTRDLSHQYEAYIQPKEQSRVLDNQCRVVAQNDRVYEIVSARRLEPKAGQLVLYICELKEWPA